MNPAVATVVVTYNRRALLLECLAALFAQSRRPDLILIIDNASTDDTHKCLHSEGVLSRADVRYWRLAENLGGAGGFHHGLRQAMRSGADLIWLMDDDAAPQADALQVLLQAASSAGDIYGSVAVAGAKLCWPMTIQGDPAQRITEIAELPPLCEVEFLPFLGFLIHRSVVERIGLPDAGYFIAADDCEYSLRARRTGHKTILVAGSRIRHPSPSTYPLRVPGRILTCLRLVPWKRYYDTRNRMLLAKSYYGVRLWTQTLPSLFARLCGALLHESDKVAQVWAFAAGLCDGFLGRKGRRHERWGIKT